MPVELKVPAVGESITEVQIGRWLKEPGQRAGKDESLVELESDKATVELPAPQAGVITKILKQQGETAAVGEVIGYLDPAAAESKPSESAPSSSSSSSSSSSVGRSKLDVERSTFPTSTGDQSQKSPAAEATPHQPAAPATPPKVMPAADRALAQHGLRAADVPASGPGGRLLKEDVERHAAQAAPREPAVATQDRPAPAGRLATTAASSSPIIPDVDQRREEVVPMTSIRRRIAERLVEAQHNAALLTTFNEIDMSQVIALRQQHKEDYQEKHGVKLGFMSFFVKATLDALGVVPQLNAEVRGTDIVYRNYADIGIAVGSGKGLVVPVLRGAERMSFAQIELAISDLARRAQQNKLKLEELQGGTFTISNGGVYGSLLSTPIVNPPQSGILGLHAIQDRPIAVDGQVVIRPMMYIALTYDHRIVDGREAVTFLKRIKEVIEAPARMLLEI
jgi:2-oxoglutarate dehydrogenase E2 component (dihydrolipoamide succinyltransferase)